MQRAQAGDRDALDQLLARHLPSLRAYVRLKLSPDVRRREAASDVVQSICREVLGDLDGASFSGEDEFKAWMFQVAMNKILNKRAFHGAAKRDLQRELPDPSAALVLAAHGDLTSPSGGAIAAEELARIEDAFDQLSDEHKDVILKSRFLALTHQQIAEETGRSEAAVRQLLLRARARLGLLLSKSPDRPDSD